MRTNNPLKLCNLEQACYLLRTGRATKEDAVEYSEAWNECKVSTATCVTSVTVDGISISLILCFDL